PGLRPSFLIQVSLGRAVVDLETGRVAVAGRRVTMADQRDMTAIDECGPGLLGISGSRSWRGEQPNGKSGEHERLHMRRFGQGREVLLQLALDQTCCRTVRD